MSVPLFVKVTSPNRGMLHTTLQYIYLLTYQFLFNSQSDIFLLDYSLLWEHQNLRCVKNWRVCLIDFDCSHETNLIATALPFLFHFAMNLTCIYSNAHSRSTIWMNVSRSHSMGEYDPALLCVAAANIGRQTKKVVDHTLAVLPKMSKYQLRILITQFLQVCEQILKSKKFEY